MQILVGLLLTVGVVALFFYNVWAAKATRARGLDIGKDIRVAARRAMYKDRQDKHPAELVEDPRLAAAGIAVAVASMDQPISQAEIAALTRTAREIFDVTEREALDIVSFGRWIAVQCDSHEEAVWRLSKVVKQLAGADAGPDLVRMVTEVATANGHNLGDEEKAAIDTVRETLGLA